MSRLPALAALPLLAFSPFARADDTPPVSNPTPETIEVTGLRRDGLNLDKASTAGSRLGLTPLETPASVDVISGDEVRERGDTRVMDAVSRAPGFTSVATPGDGNSALSARGFTGVDSVKQLYDGTQLSIGAGTSTFPFDTWNVDRIEVLSGPASVLYGSGAIGGAVNIVPRKPDGSALQDNVQFTFGSDNTFREQADSTGPLGSTAAYRLDVSHNSSDGYVDRGQSKSTAISAIVQWDPRPDLHFTFSEDYGQQNPMGYFGTPLIDGQLDTRLDGRNFNVGDATINWTDNWARIKTEWNATTGLTLHNEAYWLYSNRHWREAEGYTFQPDTDLVQRDTFIEIYHNESQIGDRADATYDSTILGRNNRAVVGFEFSSVRFEHSNDSPYGGREQLDPFDFSPGSFIDLAGTTPKFRTHTQQYSGFAEDRLEILDNLSLVGGVRTDAYDLRRDSLVAGGRTKKDFLSTSYHVGAVYNPIPHLALYAQYATATDPVGSIITLSPHSQQFDLSTGREVEVGAKQTFWDERGEWTLAAYRIVKNKLLITDPTDPDITEQVGQQSSRGIEASFALALGGGWRVEANGTILGARFDDFTESDGATTVSRKGKIPPSVPEQAANAYVTWNFLPDWQARAGVRYVGKSYADNANTLTLPAYEVVDTGLTWAPTPRFGVDLRLFNALDQTYVAAPYNGGTQWILGRPRAVEVTLRSSF